MCPLQKPILDFKGILTHHTLVRSFRWKGHRWQLGTGHSRCPRLHHPRMPRLWPRLLNHLTGRNTGVMPLKIHFLPVTANVSIKGIMSVLTIVRIQLLRIKEGRHGRHSSCYPWSWLFKGTCGLYWLVLSQINTADHRLNSTERSKQIHPPCSLGQ